LEEYLFGILSILVNETLHPSKDFTKVQFKAPMGLIQSIRTNVKQNCGSCIVLTKNHTVDARNTKQPPGMYKTMINHVNNGIFPHINWISLRILLDLEPSVSLTNHPVGLGPVSLCPKLTDGNGKQRPSKKWAPPLPERSNSEFRNIR